MGGLWARLTGADQKAPIKGCFPRLKNIIRNNYRGLFGVLIPIIALSWQPQKDNPAKTVECMWLWMAWFYLVLPIPIPCTSMIPIFLLPMTGIYNSMDTCKCYFNENIALFILSSMILLLLNNSGIDRRIAIKILSSGDTSNFSGKSLVFKCSMASYILSMFSNKLIVTSTITEYITPILISAQGANKQSEKDTNIDDLRNIINNSIQTSSNIGSIAILHSSYGVLAFKTIWCEVGLQEQKEYPDLFNYLQYSVFALPVSIVMFVINCGYHILLVELVAQTMPDRAVDQIRTSIMKEVNTLPPSITLYEKLTVFFTLLFLVVIFSRYIYFGHTASGWSLFNLRPETDVPVVKDIVVAAIFVIVLHILPKSCHFLNIVCISKKSQLKEIKPESAILWWRFIDKNTNYGYFFVLGAGVAIYQASIKSELYTHIIANSGTLITEYSLFVGVLLVCLITTVLSNVMSGIAVVVCFLPFILNLAAGAEDSEYKMKIFQPALGVGIAASLGFCFPFYYTPSYFCHHVGKVPVRKMVKYSIISALLCCLVLWMALYFYAPLIFGESVELKDSPLIITSKKEAPAEPEPEPAPAPEEL